MKSTLIVSMLSTLVFFSCCGGNGSAASIDEAGANAMTGMNREAGVLAALPAVPDAYLARASIAGVDANHNGLRDDIEIILARASLHEGGGASAADFDRLIEIVKPIQPSEDTQSISIKKFYCRYQALPASIKARVGASMILGLVSDTPARKKIFTEQSIAASGPLDAEACL